MSNDWKAELDRVIGAQADKWMSAPWGWSVPILN